MSPGPIDELRAAFEQPFWNLGRNAAQDRATVLVSWPSVPVELVRAAGLSPVFARGRGVPTPAADRVLVPTAALSSRDGAPGVWVLQREGNDTRTRFFPIEAGPAEGDRTTIVKGLSGGERVVLDPPEGLKDGERVTVADR